MDKAVSLAWTDFYTQFADTLRPYRENRTALIEKIQSAYRKIQMSLPTLEKGGVPEDIDPFTVFGMFNKGITDANRKKIIGGFAEEFAINAEIPDTFDGIPLLNNQKATFYGTSLRRPWTMRKPIRQAAEPNLSSVMMRPCSKRGSSGI